MSERFSREVLALALARESAAKLKRTDGYPAGDYDTVRYLIQAVETLDNLGVFSSVDRQTDYMAAADVLSANASDRPLASPTGLAFSQIRHPSGQATGRMDIPDPAEWGDTTRADMARHQRYAENYSAGPENIKAVPDLTVEEATKLVEDFNDEADGRF